MILLCMTIVLDSLGQHLRDALIESNICHVSPCTGNIDHEAITENDQIITVMLQTIMGQDGSTGTDIIIPSKSKLRSVFQAADAHLDYVWSTAKTAKGRKAWAQTHADPLREHMTYVAARFKDTPLAKVESMSRLKKLLGGGVTSDPAPADEQGPKRNRDFTTKTALKLLANSTTWTMRENHLNELKTKVRNADPSTLAMMETIKKRSADDKAPELQPVDLDAELEIALAEHAMAMAAVEQAEGQECSEEEEREDTEIESEVESEHIKSPKVNSDVNGENKVSLVEHITIPKVNSEVNGENKIPLVEHIETPKINSEVHGENKVPLVKPANIRIPKVSSVAN